MGIENEDMIIAWIQGKLSEHEKAAFDRRYTGSEAFRKEADDYRFVWEQASLLRECDQFHTRKNWERLSAKMHRHVFLNRTWNALRTVAAFLLLPLLGVTAYLWFSPHTQPAQQTEIQITSAYGLVSHFTLPDSTVVWLNSGSTLIYPQRFEKGVRKVKLSGEAYFRVKSDKKNRFEVEVPQDMTVSAYGTEFNVSAYSEESTTETVLAKGHVELTDRSGRLADMRVGQSTVVSGSTAKTVSVSNVNIEEKTGWKDGKIIFRRTALLEVSKRLARHFGADFELRGKNLNAYEYSATFTTESLPEILSLLGKASPLKVQIIEPEMKKDFSFPRKKIILTLEN